MTAQLPPWPRCFCSAPGPPKAQEAMVATVVAYSVQFWPLKCQLCGTHKHVRVYCHLAPAPGGCSCHVAVAASLLGSSVVTAGCRVASTRPLHVLHYAVVCLSRRCPPALACNAAGCVLHVRMLHQQAPLGCCCSWRFFATHDCTTHCPPDLHVLSWRRCCASSAPSAMPASLTLPRAQRAGCQNLAVHKQ